ncbi:autophagy-related protein 2 homolog B isoform X1 [Anguilla anguilla]|uniref:autophagy-related protein 2 homolog B isoform X1 n=1 Tax=Anguilla anguilla TaxID=7936 RepID=UPI0015B0493F|nr:autophagy-related protein 2 homolog B isoform X1 [Anguilla anguilla]XP_035280542.1 autophagy-related protein 2 homolog B isoform X1 [Anguilla anguilla]
MPWPFSESIKKRACRYLLHRYLGNFLQEKLSLDQLSLDLYQGTGSLAQVPLDKWSLNEILESVDAPFEVTEGFIQTISLTVPWASLLQENCALEVKGLEMVFRPRPRMASGTEPMYWSSFMTSSMQLAKECLSQRLTDELGEGFQPLEGLETFAETIETVLRRVKVTFLNTVLRIEHVPENSKTGIALEIRINKIVYCDETGDECSGMDVHQPTTFAHKNLQLTGVTIFWDEFSEAARACHRSPSGQVETEAKLSPSWNPKIICEPHPQFTEPVSTTTPFEPVQIGSLSGRVELSLLLKQNEALPGAKLDVDGQIDLMTVLLSPRQVHLLLDMFGVFSGSAGQDRAGLGKDRKSRPMQQEDEYRLHMELHRCLKRDSMAPGALGDPDLFESQTTRTTSSREDVFFSMAEMDMSHSLSSLPPLGDPPTVDLDLSLNSNFTSSPGESPSGNVATVWDEYLDTPRQREKQAQEPPFLSRDPQPPQKLLRQASHASKAHCDESRPELVFRLTLGSVALSVLHIDRLPPPDTAVSPLALLASDFFRRLEATGPEQLQGGLLFSRPVFDEACPQDHLRFLGTGMKVVYEQRQGSSLRSVSTDVSVGQMELLECLLTSDAHSSTPQYTELVKFDAVANKEAQPSPCLHLLYKFTERRGPQGGQVRLSTMPRKEFQVELGPVRSELDISIVDRLNSLLQPQKLVTTEAMASHMYTSYNKHVSLHKAFAEVFLDDSRTPANCHVSVMVNAPVLCLAVRFPIPDLRSDQERGPWFKKSLQKEALHLEFLDLELKTEFTGGSSSEQTKMELTFRELTGKFQDDSSQPAARFLRVSHDMDGDMTTSDSGKFDWPRVVLRVNPTAVHSILERVTAEEDEEAGGHSPEEDEGGAHSLKDVCDFGKPDPSPFSSRRVMYENEEMVMPGDVGEMTEFQEKTMSNSRYILELALPNVQVSLPNKAFYEKLHNRINNDLLLWEPTAPSPVETVENVSYGVGLSVASQLISTYGKDSFSQFRSSAPEEEDSGSDEDTMQYYSPADLGLKTRRKKKFETQNKTSQSLFSVILSVSHGLVALQTNAKQEDKTVLKNRHGEFWMEVENGVLFSVTQYEGYKDQHYVCLHTSSLCLYHQGVVDGDVAVSDVKLPSQTRPHWLEPAIYRSEEMSPGKASPSEGIGLEAHSMLSVAVKISSQNMERNVKEFLVAVGVRGATLQHRVVPSSLGWYDQLVDFLNVSDEPVLGYVPPTSVTTLHLHLWSCALDYRPLYLPIRSLLTVETFSISSSVSLDHSSSTLRIILDEAALFLSDKCNAVSVNLTRDYVQVVDMGMLELRITAVKPGADGARTEPRFELRCSSDVIHIRTCSDSCAALMNLIQYIASYGDLLPPPGPEVKSTGSKQKAKPETGSRPPSQIPLLPEAEQQMLQDLMSEAMEETDGQQTLSPQPNGLHQELRQDLEPPRSDLFLFPDESGNLSQEPSPTFPTYHSPLIYTASSAPAHESDDFCILETPGSGAADRDEEPVVNKLTPDSIQIKDNHFSLPAGPTDSSRGPLNFPVPEVRYLVKEISIVWHLYGGKDFGSGAFISSPSRSRGCTPHSSPSQTPVRQGRPIGRLVCGRGRKPDVLMEIQLTKVKFQHEVYPHAPADSGSTAAEQPVSRQVFTVQDLEIRDRLATSQMNKFLYLYSSKEMPRKAHSNMLTVKAVHMCPEAGHAPQECCLRVSLMPLRLNIDQDALFFLKDFFASLAADVEMFAPPDQEALCVSVKKPPAPDLSCSFPKHGGGAQDPAPIISVPGQPRPSQNGVTLSGSADALDPEASAASFTDQPIFFREFRFTSEVPIRLDYHGKHLAMEQGTFAGIVIGLTQLNCSELKLRRLCYRQGLLGVDKLFSYAISEWLNDIKKNQLPGLLGGVGPIHSLVQLVQGFRDLVWLPIEQYRKDGRIVRGFQRGAASFGTSTAMAALELTNRMVRTIQAAAETAYDMVSPGPDECELKKIKRYSHYRLAHQPVDLREGVAKAYSVVKEGIADTALTIYDTATREHEQRGVTGAVGGVLRQLPPAVVKPLIVATEATSNVLGGMRNQIHPDARQEESQKWRQGEE